MNRRRGGLAITLLVLMTAFQVSIVIMPSEAIATTRFVGGVGPGNYTTIQQAIDAAIPGDTVYVYSGTYYENVLIDRPLSLVGEDRSNTIIDGGGFWVVIRVDADGVSVGKFTVRNSGSGMWDAGIEIHRSIGCTLWENTLTATKFGIYLNSTSGNTITENEVFSNIGYGIYLHHSDNNLLTNNSVFDHFLIGIRIFDSNRNTVTDNTAYNNSAAIAISSSDGNIMSGNHLTDNGWGIALESSKSSVVSNNTMFMNGIGLWGYVVQDWNTHTIDTSNIVNGRPVIYWKNIVGGIVPENVSQVILANCTDVTVENQNVSYASAGVSLGFSDRIVVANNSASYPGWGILLQYTTNSTVKNNSFSGKNFLGIRLWGSEDNAVVNNTLASEERGGAGTFIQMYSKNNSILYNEISDYSYGVMLDSTSHNIFENNTVSNSWTGVYAAYSEYNVLANNTISDNFRGLLFSSDTANNRIYHNKILYNTIQAEDMESNIWDNGYPSGGNHWSDYNGQDQCSGPSQDICPDPDGIGDTQYDIDLDSMDHYPLVNQSTVDVLPPTVSIVSPSEGVAFTVPQITVIGTASDTGDSGLERVEMRVNGGEWQKATGTSSWSGLANLQEGANLIEALAWDNASNPSDTDMVNVTYTPPNNPPTAAFTVTPTVGSTDTLFTFDASSSHDPEDAIEDLEIRWDWNNDGTWDTSWSTDKTALHQYAQPGDYSVSLEVRDTGGLIDNHTKTISVSQTVDDSPPDCWITTPNTGEELSGISTVSGGAWDDIEVQRVEIRIDEGSWVQVTGTTLWDYSWDTTTVPNGEHTIYARAYDGNHYSEEANVTGIVINPTPEADDWIWVAAVLIILAAVLVIIILFALMRRRRRQDEEPERHSPPEKQL
ncbi:MAG: right-handed parallel beta-helix repeat-containing protein [Thermoplasmata archaeon]|nr:right-handed parallel beta-helix repeat-containing protein [Thermoplasmata archaeon]